MVAVAASCGSYAPAQTAAVIAPQVVVEGVSVSDFKMDHNGDFLTVDMLLDLNNLKVGGNRAVLLTPQLINGTDTLNMPSVGIYGRRRYYVYVRNGQSMLTGKDEMSYKASDKPATLPYNQILPYQEWMDGATLTLLRRDYGCCNKMLASQDGMLGQHMEPEMFMAELIYVRPKAEMVKSRSLEGSAYIDFPVDQTVIYPDYRRNTVELAKIQATIDSVRYDKDVTITQIWLKGFASPESPYSHNRDLAIGRTRALKTYISQLYHFADNIIVTDYEPEDWEGLRRFVEKSNINHKTEILAIIDSDREPDHKEAFLKKSYPQEYRFLLQSCYPALRHTNYRIAYNIRSYSDAKEIERIMRTHPQNLSLNEFYLVAQKYEPGTQAFCDVFETAVRLYPDDEIANLNAANAAMSRGDNTAAVRYLTKAGNSAEAIYARGALAMRNEDYKAARQYFNQAKALGLHQAGEAIDGLDRMKK